MSKTLLKIHINAFIVILLSLFYSCSKPKASYDENNSINTEKSNYAHPNIILLIADEVSTKHIGVYGGNIPTPQINKLAQNGMVFNNVYTSSALCTPSRYSIMTGQYPGRCNHKKFLYKNPVNDAYLIGNTTFIDSATYTLHRHMKKAGYYTGFVGKFHLGPASFASHIENHEIPDIKPDISPDSDEADSLLARYQSIVSDEVKKLTGCDFTASIQWDTYNSFPLTVTGQNNIEWITNGAIEFLKTVSKLKPFFLQVNSTMLNGIELSHNAFSDPKFTPEGRRLDAYKYHPERKTIKDRLHKAGLWNQAKETNDLLLYKASTVFIDDQVGVLTDFLDRTGLAENTIFIFTSDHGALPGKSTCFEAGIHVPFIVKYPNSIIKRSVCNDFVQLVDILPTFADLTDKSLPNDYIFDGESFLPLLKSKKSNSKKFIYSEIGYSRAIFDGRYKYIATRINALDREAIQIFKQKSSNQFIEDSIILKYGANDSSTKYFCADMLFDLKTDPNEKQNLITDVNKTDKLNELQDTLQNYLSSFGHPFPLNDSIPL